jgi:hypothetical protein
MARIRRLRVRTRADAYAWMQARIDELAALAGGDEEDDEDELDRTYERMAARLRRIEEKMRHGTPNKTDP